MSDQIPPIQPTASHLPSTSKSTGDSDLQKILEQLNSFNINEPTSVKVEAVSPKLQDFWSDNPDGWLRSAEYQFRIARISDEETKFYHVAAKLPEKINHALRDMLTDDYQPGQYQALKQAIVNRFTPTIDMRLRQLLDEEEINGRHPSQFLRDLLTLAREQVSIDIVLNRWMTKLPKIVVVSVKPLADQIIEQKEKPARVALLERMMNQADSISDLISSSSMTTAATSFHRRRRSSVSSNENRRSRKSNRQYNPNGSWCKNHFLYRERARQCGRPEQCTFRPPKNRSRRSSISSTNEILTILPKNVQEGRQ